MEKMAVFKKYTQSKLNTLSVYAPGNEFIIK
jgi:hypothetical protein